MSVIIQAKIGEIGINPYRRLHDYPYIETKIDALMRSIAEVGLWPSIIGRPVASNQPWRYEIAFGHHRLEAAERSGLEMIPLIVEELSDMQMLQYMGRENLEDYNASFLIQLESWEAVIHSGFLSAAAAAKRPQAIDIATILGWLEPRKGEDTFRLNDTARACHAAYTLIEGGYHDRNTYQDVTVKAARDIAEAALRGMSKVEKAGKTSTQPRRVIEQAKQHFADSAEQVADKVRTGKIAHRDIRHRVDFGAMALNTDKRSPLFATFANIVADNIRRTLRVDADAEKLDQIEKVLGEIELLEDWEALRRLDVELLNLAERAQGWQKRLVPPKTKVVKFELLERKREMGDD